MALLILENNGKFYVSGKITSKNVAALKTHFEYVLATNEKFVINIDEVTEIDAYGVFVITELYKKAQSINTDLSIEGIGSKDIYEHFINQNIA